MSFQLANGNFQLPGGGPVANGVLTLTLSNSSATVIATGGAATASYTFTLDANGNLPAGSTVLGNNELTPGGTYYTASLVTSGGTSVPLANTNWVVGPSAPYAGSLFPDVSVYPSLSISGTVPGALSITGNTGLPAASTVDLFLAGNFGSPILGKIYIGDGTGWELDFAKRSASVDTTLFQFKDSGQLIATGNISSKLGAASGAAVSVGNATGLAYIDGSSGTSGQGGYINFTNVADSVTGYSCWSTSNAFFNGTNWIQPRGTLGSHGLAVSNHKDFSFNFASAVGTNNSTISWTEWANLNATGFNLKTGNYLVNGAQISASNLSNGVSGSGAVALVTSPSFTTPTLGAATATSINKVSITAPATSATLTIANGKTLTANNSLTLAGSDAATITFQGTDTYVGRATVDTLTNKRVTPRAVAVADGTAITPNSDTSDVVTQTNTQVAGTLTIANPTGTPTDGQKLIIRIKTTNAQTYSFGTSFAFSTSVTAPTSIAAGKTDYLGCIWNATNSKWDVVAVDQGH